MSTFSTNGTTVRAPLAAAGVGRLTPPLVAAIVAGVAFFLLVGAARGGPRAETPTETLRVEGLEVHPAIALSGSQVTVRGFVRNAGTRALRSVFVAGTVTTDASPGMQTRFDGSGGIRGLPVLAPGTNAPFQATFSFEGDGWVRAGVMAWSAEETGRPLTKRVLIIRPSLSIVELVTFLAMSTAIVASFVGLAVWLRRLRKTASRARLTLVIGLLSLGGAIATWLFAVIGLRSFEPSLLRVMVYGGVILAAGAWLLLGGYVTRRESIRARLALLAMYMNAGVFWIVSFHTWEGLRPTAIASTPQSWFEALWWPLHLSQALLGLRFG
jgi:hypothetical protein